MSSDLREQLQVALGDAYRVTRELGGGMARVFVADDIATGEQVVVKVLAPDLSAGVSLERFRREIQVAASLSHPNVVPVRNAGQRDKLIWYSMPLIGGDSLRALLQREGQLPVARAVEIAHDVGAALSYAHSQNIVHRDIKPDNILIDASGRAIVADFGIARAIEKSADVVSVTSTGLTLGTPQYMSPEQAAGDSGVDGRSDVYSLACVVYEMLAGEPPFTGPTAQAIIARHIHEAPRSLRVIRPGMSPALQAVVEKGLAKNAADRYQTAESFVGALKAPEASTVAQRPVRRTAFRRIVPAGLAAAAVAVLALPSVYSRFLANDRLAPRSDPRRIAVLDFQDLSPDRRLGHIASGLASSLVHELGAVSAIQVVSRNAIQTLSARGAPLDSIIRELAVGSLVEGSVQRSGDVIRVRVQLVDPRTHTQVANASFQREAGELFLLEDDLAHQVASLLRRRIGAEIQVRNAIAGTRVALARELVFQADGEIEAAMRAGSGTVAAAGAPSTDHLIRADTLFALAAQADNAWSVPPIARGRTQLMMARQQSGTPRAASFRRAFDLTTAATTRWPDAAGGYAVRGSARYWEAALIGLPDAEFRHRLDSAESDLRTAIRLDSSVAAAWGVLALVHIAKGETDSAEVSARRALALDTFLADAPAILASVYAATLMRGSYADSWRWCELGAADFPQDVQFIQCKLALLAEDLSRPPDTALARRLLATATRVDSPEHARASGRRFLPLYRQLMVAAVAARAGDATGARAEISRVRAGTVGDPALLTDVEYEEAYVRMLVGDKAGALRLLETYVAARPALRELVSTHARWQPLRTDERFVRLVSGAAHQAPTPRK